MIQMKVIDGLLYQWDTGRRVQIIASAGEAIDEVHYSNGMVVETTEEGDTLTAPIPNVLLQLAQNITVYAVTVTEDGTRTVHAHTFNIGARPKPDDYVYTETEVKRWSDLDTRLTTSEKQCDDLDTRLGEAEKTLKTTTDTTNKNNTSISNINKKLDGIPDLYSDMLKGKKRGNPIIIDDCLERKSRASLYLTKPVLKPLECSGKEVNAADGVYQVSPELDYVDGHNYNYDDGENSFTTWGVVGIVVEEIHVVGGVLYYMGEVPAAAEDFTVAEINANGFVNEGSEDTYTTNEEGKADLDLYDKTKITAANGVVIYADYFRDLNKVIAKLEGTL